MARLTARRNAYYYPNAGKTTPPFATFKIDIAKEKKNGATELDIEAYKLFNASNERTLTSCYREIAHLERDKVKFLTEKVTNKLKAIQEKVKNG